MNDYSERELLWNRCDYCGRYIAFSKFDDGRAVRRLLYPDSDRTVETWETLCEKHAQEKK